jgi:hypothetical protein
MLSYIEADHQYLHSTLKNWTAATINPTPTLERAAQLYAEQLFSDFSTSVLIRIYATIPYAALPEKARSFAHRLATSAGVADQLYPDTQVLCLMGTKGKRAEWSDRQQSKGHQAIPLVSSKFVQAIPMITRLLNEFGIGTDWLDLPDKTSMITKSMGKIATVFYVPDAATARDPINRLVIPAQDFVKQNGVKTVFGVGGAYAVGCICTVLCFVSETLDRSVVDRFLPVINFFKQATTRPVMDGRFFA